MLIVKDLHVYYGGIHAIKGISIEVADGAIVTLIGANGAGKSSTLRSIAGLIKQKSGSITFNDVDISKLSPEKIVESGIVLVPEGRKIFPNLTVMENLMLGAYLRKDDEGIKRDLEQVFELFPRLKERSWQKGGTLSGGRASRCSLLEEHL